MTKFIYNLLFPHDKNNYRSKILHNSSIFLLLIIVLSFSFIFHVLNTTRPDILGISYYISDTELMAQVNRARQDNGLPPLVMNSELSDAARRKAADMFQKNYWAHFAPDGSTSPWGFIKAAGYRYVYAGENLAKGFTDSGSIINAWMNSPSHRENILSSKYKDVGFAIVPGQLSGEETVLVVEMFGAQSQMVASVPQASTQAPPQKSGTVSGSQTLTTKKIETPAISPTPVRVVAINNPKIDAKITSQAASTVGLSFLAFSFMLDLVIVERKKIPRIVGHNLDHIILILMFLFFLVLKARGFII